MKHSSHHKAKKHMEAAKKHHKQAEHHMKEASKAIKGVGSVGEEKRMSSKGNYKGNAAKKSREAI